MHLDLLRNADLPVRIHFACAALAFGLGIVQLLRGKGTPVHVALGRLWVALMLVISVSSFWIRGLMPHGPAFGFSPIHLLSVFVIVQMVLGVYYARTGNILRHRRSMRYTFVGGLLIAGAFTFVPGRLLYRVFIA